MQPQIPYLESSDEQNLQFREQKLKIKCICTKNTKQIRPICVPKLRIGEKTSERGYLEIGYKETEGHALPWKVNCRQYEIFLNFDEDQPRFSSLKGRGHFLFFIFLGGREYKDINEI